MFVDWGVCFFSFSLSFLLSLSRHTLILALIFLPFQIWLFSSVSLSLRFICLLPFVAAFSLLYFTFPFWPTFALLAPPSYFIAAPFITATCFPLCQHFPSAHSILFCYFWELLFSLCLFLPIYLEHYLVRYLG